MTRNAKQFLREANMHTLHHLNIVKFFGVTFEPNNYGFILEYLPQKSLNIFLGKNKVSMGISCLIYDLHDAIVASSVDQPVVSIDRMVL